MVKLTHDYPTCQAHHPEKFPLLRDALANVGKRGYKVHASYSNRLEHTSFMIREADTFEQLDAAFDPILEMGNFEVGPVVLG